MRLKNRTVICLSFLIYLMALLTEELMIHIRSKLSEKIQNTFFVHYNERKRVNDKNGDLFLDKPIQDQINLLSKWQFTDASNGLVSF